MNKGFLGVFVLVLLGAMVLITVNQKMTRPPAGGPALSDRAPSDVAANRVRNATAQAPSAQVRPADTAGPGSAVPASSPAADAVKPAPAGKPAAAESAPAADRKPAVSVPASSAAQAASPPLPRVEPPISQTAAKPDAAKPDPAKQAAAAGAAKPAGGALQPIPAGSAAPAGATRPAANAQPALSAPVKPDGATPVAKPAAAAAKGAHALKSVSLHFKNKGMVLRLEAGSPITGKAFVLPGPDRLVVDLSGEWGGVKAPPIPANTLVKGARIGQQSGGPRLVLDLSRAPKKWEKMQPSPTVMEIAFE